MIYDTNFKNLIVSSFDIGNDHAHSGAQQTTLAQSLIVLYTGDIPTNENFVSYWDSKYKFDKVTSDIQGGIVPVGSNILCSYGSTVINDLGGPDTTDVKIKRVNNEFYMDTHVVPHSTKHADGTPGFAVLFPHSAHVVTNLDGNDGIDNQAFMILSVSDMHGDGIVKISSMDTTLSTEAPTLMSVEFEVNMGE